MIRVFCKNEKCKHHMYETNMCMIDVWGDKEINLDEYGMCDDLKLKDEEINSAK